ncbi:hypothetical protein [Fructilactobacillus carniphilus]|uniref:Uncharacterized protein n=1 Tax=Fructilactobacillus carniphilus TaxID=2940297 RepID=A0ABY5BVG1_9LACO|nr:hypothetical protein [Fructilactobacillus carniphilus]USS90485.1 hypothetical protein M3M37_06505 [Fructilactobacillus carniphilus]
MVDTDFTSMGIIDIKKSIPEVEIFLKKHSKREDYDEDTYNNFINYLINNNCNREISYYNNMEYYNKESYCNHLKKYKHYIKKHKQNKKANISPRKPKRDNKHCWIHLHHVNENKFPNLGSPISIYKNFDKYKQNNYEKNESNFYENFWKYENQDHNNIVPCNVLEHTVLHAIILIVYGVKIYGNDNKNGRNFSNGYSSLEKKIYNFYNKIEFKKYIYDADKDIMCSKKRVLEILDQLKEIVDNK